MGSVDAALCPREKGLNALPLLLAFERRANRTGRETLAGFDVLAASMILVDHAHSIASKNALRQDTTIFAEST